jgi:hypothetical protein
LPVASTLFATLATNKLVRLYRHRIQIEEAFRDMKSQHFGEGLEKRMRPGSEKRRAYSRLFLARLILTLDSCRTTSASYSLRSARQT